MSQENKNLYTGTLIFCIITGVISITILVLFFTINVEPVKYLLLTIELILLIIIIHSITTIILYERSLKKFTDVQGEQPIINLSCPDYFTKMIDNGTSVCNNAYETSKTILIIGEPLEINLSELSKMSGIETCKEYVSKYDSKIPWTELKSQCETI